jgi:hypothetical protein
MIVYLFDSVSIFIRFFINYFFIVYLFDVVNLLNFFIILVKFKMI